ncbi:MAG: class I SAM-dependent methyltransferase [Ignavibacteriaceae bacterium]
MAEETNPDPQFIAQQLRKPSGDFAKTIGEKMNQINSFLYDFVLDSMNLKENENILEIGFGNGKFFDRLFSRANNLHVSGIDFSEEMVKEAEQNDQSLISSGKLKLFLGSSDNLPFPDNFFDKVFCSMVIYFWEEPSKHLREIKRVLKPEGKFYTGIRAKDGMLEFPFTKHCFILYKENEWKSILQQNGFELTSLNKKLDPLTEFNGQAIQLESICFTAKRETES